MIEFSSALQHICAYACSLSDSPDAPLTAERYLIAVIDLIDGELRFDGCEALVGVLGGILGEDFDRVRTKDGLLDYLSKMSGRMRGDELHMHGRIKAACARAEAAGLSVLTPELLLECILEVPGEQLHRCLVLGCDTGGGTAPSLLDRAVDGLFSDFAASTVRAAAACRFADGPSNVRGVPRFRAALERLKNLTQIFDTETLRVQIDARLSADNQAMDAELPETAQRGLVCGCAADDRTLMRKIADLTRRVGEMRTVLSERVLGQARAVSVLTEGYFQAELLTMTDPNRVRPAAFLFAGPPGVGKTYLAEQAAGLLGRPFARFDMSEYADREASIEFCGSDSVYRNGKAGNFTSFIARNPACVILFDEIERAHSSIIHLFLQILDAGRIRDNNSDRELSLCDAILIFTTNAGRQFYESAERDDFSDVPRKVILQALQKDINPQTGMPYFPAAICSRFAAGNVVMFNRMTTQALYHIARRALLRQAENFTRGSGVGIEIDERVYAALLFAEGGAADARTVRGRAEAFIGAELFELFRLLEANGQHDAIGQLEKISIGVELPTGEASVDALFDMHDLPQVLLFTSPQMASCCMTDSLPCAVFTTDSRERAMELLRSNTVGMLLLDLQCGLEGEHAYLNIEDAHSAAGMLFADCRRCFPELPVYLLETPAAVYHEEELASLQRRGMSGRISIDGFAERLRALCIALHRQRGMRHLAVSNRLVSYGTAQKLSADGRRAEILLGSFALERAVDAEDSRQLLSDITRPEIGFAQVIGAEDAKAELKYFVDYLRNPARFRGLGIPRPRGVLLYGPPGTGKTMLARAMAGESDVTFIAAEGNQFHKRYVGEGAEAVHALFRTARKYAPSILFIDEIDAIGRVRGDGRNETAEDILTALLTELDGFRDNDSKPVFVLAATNYAAEAGRPDSLDGALVRRFDRCIFIDLPDRHARVRYMRGKCAENAAYAVGDDMLEALAVRSTGMSLAELGSVFAMALRSAHRDGNLRVTDAVLEEAFETFCRGERKAWQPELLLRVARHEAGHALLSYLYGETPAYVTVAARAGHGGYVQHDERARRPLYTRTELLAQICTGLGGRAAELVCYGDEEGISTGAQGDLRQATELAEELICAYGMDDGFGPGVLSPEAIHTGPLAQEVRTSVNAILRMQLSRAVGILTCHRDALDRLVEALIEKTHMSGGELEALLTRCVPCEKRKDGER